MKRSCQPIFHSAASEQLAAGLPMSNCTNGNPLAFSTIYSILAEIQSNKNATATLSIYSVIGRFLR